jgi:hypothetical protein
MVVENTSLTLTTEGNKTKGQLEAGETITVRARVTTGLARNVPQPRFPFVVIWGIPAEAGQFEAADSFTADILESRAASMHQAVTIQRQRRPSGAQDVVFEIQVRAPTVISKEVTATVTAEIHTLRGTAPTTNDEFMQALSALSMGADELAGRFQSAELDLTLKPGPKAAPEKPTPPVVVELTRARVAPTDDQALWSVIRVSTQALSFERYEKFIDGVFCLPGPFGQSRKDVNALARSRGMPFPDMDPYRLLKVATEVFMRVNCGVFFDTNSFDEELLRIDSNLGEEGLRMGRSLAQGDIDSAFQRYVGDNGILPYLDLVLDSLRDWRVTAAGFPQDPDLMRICNLILREKLTNPCLVELIWSYWHEEGMLVQTMKAITMRFQNRQGGNGMNDPLALVEIDPLRPLNNFLWGYVQDEDHRLTVPRRAFEYDHHYGLTLLGKAVPRVRGADSRSRFIEAFHNLLYLCAIFFKEDDDTTVVADGFPILNALREVHLLLTQGAHNQYLDLPWAARQEMLMEEWILGRPEFREFLPRRIMVDYPEQWMHSVEAMKGLQGWNNTDVLHFRDLGISGERILLSIRFGGWTTAQFAESAANWARYFRSEIQRYTHAYRAVTGVDLTEHPDSTMPALLLRQRLPRRNGGQGIPLPTRSATALPSRPSPRALSPATGQPASRELAEWGQHEVE